MHVSTINVFKIDIIRNAPYFFLESYIAAFIIIICLMLDIAISLQLAILAPGNYACKHPTACIIPAFSHQICDLLFSAQ